METDQPIKKDPTYKKLWKEISWGERFMVGLMIAFMIYLNYSTELVPNTTGANETRTINGVTFPPKSIIYQPQDYVPKSHVSNTQTFLGVLLFLLVVIMLLSKRANILRRATIKEAIEDLGNQLIEIRNIKDAQISLVKDGLKITSDLEEIDLTYLFLTRYKSKGGEREAFRYVIKVVIRNKSDETEDLYKAYYQPMTRYWDGLVPTTHELSEADRCPKCGNDFDELIIISEDLMKLKRAKDAVGGTKGLI